jgi:hypothetical protein
LTNTGPSGTATATEASTAPEPDHPDEGECVCCFGMIVFSIFSCFHTLEETEERLLCNHRMCLPCRPIWKTECLKQQKCAHDTLNARLEFAWSAEDYPLIAELTQQLASYKYVSFS